MTKDETFELEFERFFNGSTTRNKKLIYFYDRYLVAKEMGWTFDYIDNELDYEDFYYIKKKLILDDLKLKSKINGKNK